MTILNSQLKEKNMTKLQYENSYTATVWGLEDFCRAKGLEFKAMNMLNEGLIKQYMGWKVVTEAVQIDATD
jgi:hypothetical protein